MNYFDDDKEIILRFVFSYIFKLKKNRFYGNILYEIVLEYEVAVKVSIKLSSRLSKRSPIA